MRTLVSPAEGYCRLESRMREIRTSGSEGGEAASLPYPYRFDLLYL